MLSTATCLAYEQHQGVHQRCSNENLLTFGCRESAIPVTRIPGLLCYRIINNPRANSGSSVLLVDLDPSFTDYAVSDPLPG